jgi:glycosyltransferase involved in cell wall biosynthesis
MESCLLAGQVSPGEADMGYFAEEHGVQPIILPRLAREISCFDDLATLWRVYQFFRRTRPHIVHTHTAKAGAIGRLAGLLARVPVLIHTFHGHVFYGYFGRFKTTCFLWVERLLALFTNKLIVISEKQREEVCHRYQIAEQNKFAVIPLGFDLAQFLSVDRRTECLSSPGQGIRVGIIGRMVPVKNHGLAVSICEKIFHEQLTPLPMQFVMVGDGPLRESLEGRVAALGLEGRINFVGWQRDLPRTYQSLDLILLTSINEGTPVALIESMAAGLPFVATGVGGVRDMVDGEGIEFRNQVGEVLYVRYKNGILVKPGDVKGAATALAYLAEEPKIRQEMGEAGRRFVQDRYAKERLLHDMRTLYQGLIAQRGK